MNFDAKHQRFRAQFLFFFLLYGHQFCRTCLFSCLLWLLLCLYSVWFYPQDRGFVVAPFPGFIFGWWLRDYLTAQSWLMNHHETVWKKGSHSGPAHVWPAGATAVTSLTRLCGPSAITPRTRSYGTWFCSPSCWAWGSCSWCSAASRWSMAALAASAETAAKEKMYVKQNAAKMT